VRRMQNPRARARFFVRFQKFKRKIFVVQCRFFLSVFSVSIIPYFFWKINLFIKKSLTLKG
jgi:hypothetical protein